MNKKPDEFYILLRGDCKYIRGINWACHGESSVYLNELCPEEGDKVIKVREVIYKKKSKKKTKKLSVNERMIRRYGLKTQR